MDELVDRIYREESRRVLATLIRLLGDFDLAEEALHDAFAAAVEQWGDQGVPSNPRAWLVSTGRFKAIDQLRRRARHDASLTELALHLQSVTPPDAALDGPAIEDDRLRLIFTCCHPGLAIEARLALTLREVCGLTTEEVARAFLVPAPTVAAHRPGEGQDPRCTHSVRGARARRSCGALGRGVARDLSRVQRGILGEFWRRGHAS